ncbi:hypothetical protein LIER_43568 [Lithospermum erythrorhizon]|uniref:Uncharacterized protein n=1 Tax=Lithospermum erythrorhizon TaxID=34254 RepID=A0AAV3QFU0_LITER
MFRTQNYINIEIPLNIANYLHEMNQIVIRNGNRTWKVALSLGHFCGDEWRNLTRDCGLMIGYQLFFFINTIVDLEMLVLGNEGVEVVFSGAKEYHKII